MTDVRRTIGATTLSATGGSDIGGALAAIILCSSPNTRPCWGPVTIVVSVACALVRGWLSPSKAATLALYLDQATEDIAQRVATKAPSAQEVAEAVAERTETKTSGAVPGRGSYVG